MAKIKNLLFDFGGVLVKIDVFKAIAAFKALGFTDVDKELDPYVQKGFFGKLEGGIINDEDFRKAVSEHCGHEVTWGDCQRAWLKIIVGVEHENLIEIQRLRSQGYQIAMLSNINPFMASWFRSTDFDGLGNSLDYYIPREHQYLSFELKNMKPRKEIFEMVLAHEGFNADDTLFIDDGEINLKGAQALGLHTFLPQNGELWGKRLEQELNIVIR